MRWPQPSKPCYTEAMPRTLKPFAASAIAMVSAMPCAPLRAMAVRITTITRTVT